MDLDHISEQEANICDFLRKNWLCLLNTGSLTIRVSPSALPEKGFSNKQVSSLLG